MLDRAALRRAISAGSTYLSEFLLREVMRLMRNPCSDHILIKIQHHALRAAVAHAVNQ